MPQSWRARGACRRRAEFRRRECQPCLTVPLLCSWGGFEVEGLHQVNGSLAQGHLVQGGPQVDDVAFLGAGRALALEDVVGQLDAEGSAAAVGAVDRTGAAPLRAVAAQACGQAEMFEQASDGELLLDVDEVDVVGSA
jgi:hypothetical protein